MRRIALWCLGVGLVAGFHALEHVVQAVQHFGTRTTAHGLLGPAFDNDPMHFAFNWAFYLALTPVLRAGPLRLTPAWGMFAAGFALQSYHVVDHSAKLAQHLAGLDPAPGVSGWWAGGALVSAHLAINTLVYALVAPQLLQWARHSWRPGVGVPGTLKSPAP